MRFVALSLSLLMFSTLSQAADRRDGNWWRTQAKGAQASYIIGFFDGIDLGNSFSYWDLLKAPSDSALACVNSVDQSFRKYDAYLENVTNGQLTEGVSKFYEEDLNRPIGLKDAIWLTINKLGGKSDDEMKQMIDNFRKNAN